MRQKVKVSIKIFDLQGEGIHAFAPAFISGMPINLLIDTGASKTIFDMRFVQQKLDYLHIQAHNEAWHSINNSGQMVAAVTLPDIYFNTVPIAAPRVNLLDLDYINTLYKGLNIPPIQGIMGSDWLYHFRAVLDYSTGKLKMKVPQPETGDKTGADYFSITHPDDLTEKEGE
jgi:hypothetical protein